MFRFGLIVLILFVVAFSPAAGQQIKLNYAPSPADNPVRGLVPYRGQAEFENALPCSVEFTYFTLRDLMTAPDTFAWDEVDRFLDEVGSRGRQGTFRVHCEFPGQPVAIPQYLVDAGVQLIEYEVNGAKHSSPDYSNPLMESAILSFISGLAARYDGDPRIAFITAGMLGQWGEWHTYPRSDLFPAPEFQEQVLNGFESGFQQTIVHLRYPAGADHDYYTENVSRSFGYHDDSFAFGTMPTGDPDDAWFFGSLIEYAGEEATGKWKTRPIGGEIRPEVWGCVFDKPDCCPDGQDFETCIEAMHVTWLMDSGMFGPEAVNNSPERRNEALRQIQKMGYELYVSSATIEEAGRQFSIDLVVENRGVAPFYYSWPVEILVGDEEGNSAWIETDWDLSDTVPGEDIRWSQTAELPDRLKEARWIGIRVVLPFENLRPLRFANESQQNNGVLIIR